MKRISKFEVRSSNSRPGLSGPSGRFNSKFEIRNSKFTILLAIAATLLLSCGPPHVTREKWQQMSAADKTLYVSSLIGGEKSRQQKGGAGRSFSAPPTEYVKRIDEAYRRGDQRDAAAIFANMADHT